MAKNRHFVGKADGVGGLIVPAKAFKGLKRMSVDGVEYPYVKYGVGNKRYPIIKTAQGWTIGGKVAEKQLAKNVKILWGVQLVAVRFKVAKAGK